MATITEFSAQGNARIHKERQPINTKETYEKLMDYAVVTVIADELFNIGILSDKEREVFSVETAQLCKVKTL